jgi:O-antigen/teichoic acid export membrane protein
MSFKQILIKLKTPHTTNLIGNAVMSLLNMLQVAILFNYLSMENMGVWFFFQGTIALVDTFRSGLISTAFIVSYSGTTKERATEVAGSAWVLSVLITGVFLILNIGYLLIPRHFNDLGLDLFLKSLGIVFIITLPSFIASCIAQAEQRFDRLLYIRSVSTAISILLVLLLILTQHINLMTVIYAGFVAGGTTSLMTVFLGWSRFTTIWHSSKETIKDLFRFGKYSVGTALGSNLFRNSDTYIINFMLGPSSLAVYNLALRLMELVEIPLRSFAATIMPPLSAAYNQRNKEHVIYLLKKYAGMLTMILVPVIIGSLLFAEVAIWIVDKKYLSTPAANVLRVFMTFACLMPIERFMALTLDAINQPKINLIKLIFMLAANIIGDFLGVYIFGNVYGVALASLLPVLTGLFISYHWLQRYQKFNLLDVYRVGYVELRAIVDDTLQNFKWYRR